MATEDGANFNEESSSSSSEQISWITDSELQ
jgi:hypothetical protein